MPAILTRVLFANVLRLLDERGVRVGDLPRRAGVSKEALSWAIGLLKKGGGAVVEKDPAGGRLTVARLTPKGIASRDTQGDLLVSIEGRWRERFGKGLISDRGSLERIIGAPEAGVSLLFRGLEPRPENWRAAFQKPDLLPHYPMVLHRGGYPDGS